jgi:hypothetical protein
MSIFNTCMFINHFVLSPFHSKEIEKNASRKKKIIFKFSTNLLKMHLKSKKILDLSHMVSCELRFLIMEMVKTIWTIWASILTTQMPMSLYLFLKPLWQLLKNLLENTSPMDYPFIQWEIFQFTCTNVEVIPE